MASFRQKRISRSQTLADKLRQARLDQDKTLEEAAEATKIQIKYLEILEEGDYQKLPGDIYAKAWLKLYGDFLGINTSELLVDYKIEKSVSDKLVKVTSGEKKPSHKKTFKLHHLLKPKFLKYLGVGILILAALGYLGWEVNNIISPPDISLIQPQSNNIKTTESSIVIEGQTEAEVQLTINNELVLLDEEGHFRQEINLVNGLNNLEISAKKKHSRPQIKEIVVLRESIE